MIIKGKTVLITGASGGIGKCLVQEFLNRGAAKIYAADLNVDTLTCHAKIFPIKLDVTQLADIENCRQRCSDTDILINNAGVELASPVFSQSPFKAKLEMDVNCLGVHNLCVAFWDTLKNKESAAIINILSIASFVVIPKLATYCASKAAAHSITQAFRHESMDTNVQVFGVYPGYVDTDMTKNIDVEKITPEQLVINICNKVETNIIDIFPDAMSSELARSCWPQTSILDCKFKP
mgnify:CR=1 FL=1